MTTKQKPIQILHVVGSMNRAGIESWLMNILRNVDRTRYQMDFLVEEQEKAAFDDEIIKLGSKIYRVGSKRSANYSKRIRRILSDYGPFDVVHSHMHFFDAVVLRAAAQSAVPVRISHSHNDTSIANLKRRGLRRFAEAVLRYGIYRYSTHRLAASQQAADSLFGKYWLDNDSNKIVFCGVDFSPYAGEHRRKALRSEFGFEDQHWVIGNVGRFVDQKNQEFLVRSFAEVVREVDEARLLLIGIGPLRDVIEKIVQSMGVSDRVHFAGSRGDIPSLMCGVMDMFAFPSKHEGLGLALLEAQAAGLPCLVSPAVPREADVVPELITRVSIESSWRSAILAIRNKKRVPKVYVDRMLQSEFSIDRALENLCRVYSTTTQSYRICHQ